MNTLRPLAAALALATALLSGCHVHTDKNGKNDNVDISTPFGGMHVKTNETADNTAIGISAYPGATLWSDDGDKKDHSADVNMSFGDFHLGVKAASYRSTDSVDKVLAFYKKDLTRYGDVITCKSGSAVGSPSRTSQGLTCSDKEGGHISVNEHNSDHNLELRAGSPTRQHIVGIETKDGATKIGIVALDLPKGLDKHSESESE